MWIGLNVGPVVIGTSTRPRPRRPVTRRGLIVAAVFAVLGLLGLYPLPTLFVLAVAWMLFCLVRMRRRRG